MPIRHSEHLDQIAAANTLFQAEVVGSVKGSENPFYKSRYADLTSCWRAIRPALAKHGLSVIQSPSAEGNAVSVDTLLLHVSGQWIGGTMTATAKDDSPQSVASCTTYLRRNALSAMTSLSPIDDDAEAAQGRAEAVLPSPTPPEGYENWLLTLAKSATSIATLEKQWKKSALPLRKHLTATDGQWWTDLKATAAAAEAPPA